MAELEAELAQAPVEVVIANHAFGLFQLAALHLSQQPPQLPQARLAIDAHVDSDRLIAQGLPEEAIQVANRKLALINDAYDRLRRERGQRAA